jgi:hypothetical protein
MAYSLSHAGTSDAVAMDFTIYACDFDDDHRTASIARFDLFSAEQRKVIAKYLRFTASHNENFDADVAARALERFWSQYE